MPWRTITDSAAARCTARRHCCSRSAYRRGSAGARRWCHLPFPVAPARDRMTNVLRHESVPAPLEHPQPAAGEVLDDLRPPLVTDYPRLVRRDERWLAPSYVQTHVHLSGRIEAEQVPLPVVLWQALLLPPGDSFISDVELPAEEVIHRLEPVSGVHPLSCIHRTISLLHMQTTLS